MEVTPLGMIIDTKDEQPEKAYLSMEVTCSERITVVSEFGMFARNHCNLLSANPKMAVFSDGHPSKAEELTDLSVEGRETEARELQSRKVKCSIEVTPSGMVIEAKEEQPLKAHSPKEVNLEGTVTEAREEQP
jgi:hypothetical protein